MDYYQIKLYLPKDHHLTSAITNNKTVIDVMINSKVFNQKYQYIINIVQLYLQIIFISNLVEMNTNKIKEYYWNVEIDKFSESKYNWPHIELNSSGFKLWKQFIHTILS